MSPGWLGLSSGDLLNISVSSGDIEGSIAALQRNIDNGISVDNSRRALRVLLRINADYQYDLSFLFQGFYQALPLASIG